MPLDSSQFFVAGSGSLYVAPVGTAAPTDVTAAWGAGWTECGYTEDDGVTFAPSFDTDTKTSWQALDPTNYVRTGRSIEVTATLQQWNRTNVIMAWGGGTITETAVGSGVFRYDPPDAAVIDYRAVGIEITDGTKRGRIIIPKAMVTDLAEGQFQKGEMATFGITFGVIATGAAKPFTILGNAALFPA